MSSASTLVASTLFSWFSTEFCFTGCLLKKEKQRGVLHYVLLRRWYKKNKRPESIYLVDQGKIRSLRLFMTRLLYTKVKTSMEKVLGTQISENKGWIHTFTRVSILDLGWLWVLPWSFNRGGGIFRCVTTGCRDGGSGPALSLLVTGFQDAADAGGGRTAWHAPPMAEVC